MNDKQRNKLRMFKATRDYLTKESTVWNSIVANVAAHELLETKIALIDSTVAAQGEATKGYTEEKNSVRDALETQILLVANAAAVYARVLGNVVLLAEVELTPSELDKTSDQLIDKVGTRVLNAANPVLADLGNYGITAQDITNLQAAINAFNPAKSAGDVKRAERTGLTAVLEPMFSDTMTILTERLDPLMARYKATDPAFHAGYEAARVIINLRGPGDEDEPPPVP